MSEQDTQPGSRRADIGDGDHLDELPDGAGCAEIWEHLSTSRSNPEDELA